MEEDKVKVHMDELKATNETLAGKLEYQNFNLDELNKKYLRLANRHKEVKSRLAKTHKELNQTNWISVEDRLPKKQGHYLVATPRSFPKNYRGQICEFYEDNKMFYSEYDEPIEDATHWAQLLPEPIKE